MHKRRTFTPKSRKGKAGRTLSCGLPSTRRDLEQGCKQLQGFHYQIVLRELQALSGHPDRLHEWTRAAIEMSYKYA